MKILITVRGDFVAPRFDLSAEVIVATCYDRQLLEEPRSIILSEFSAEKMCDLVLKENIGVVVCGAIEEKHYQFLTWKKITVIDSVIGPHKDAMEQAVTNTLAAGTLLPGATLSRTTS